MPQFQEGDEVIWMYTPPGGYGYTWPVLARVVRVHERTATIAAKRHDGTETLRVVRLTSLRPAENADGPQSGSRPS